MIRNNIVRADLPDSKKEPELYALVKTYQIYTYGLKCGGPVPSGEVCKKGFLRLYLKYIYKDPNRSRFIYRYLKEQDQ